MRKIVFLLLLSFEGIGQSSMILQKKLDSLKIVQLGMEQNLKNLQRQISATEQQLGLVVAKEPPVEFAKIDVINSEEILFWNDRFNKRAEVQYKIPSGSEISVVGYKKDIKDGYDYLRVIHRGKAGYVDAYFLKDNEELTKQIESIKLRDTRIDNARKVEKGNVVTARFKNLGSPLAINSVNVNVSSISTPEAILLVSNISNKDIDRYEVNITCFDDYGRAVNHPSRKNNVFRGVYQLKMEAGQNDVFGNWILNGHENATRIVVSLVSVRYVDGKIWRPAKAVTAKSY